MSKIKASIFGIEDLDVKNPLNNDIEEVIHQYARTMYRIGRLETDGRDSDKEYDKSLKLKEKLVNIIDEFFKKSN